MSNTFKTPAMIARDAAVILEDNLVMANLVNRKHEQVLNSKVGTYVDVVRVPVQTARDFINDSGTTTANDVTEGSERLQLTEQPYVRVDLSTQEKSLELDDFAQVVTYPNVLAIKDAIDSHIFDKAHQGCAVNTANTHGTNPSSLAHIATAVKELNNNKCPVDGRVGIINSTALASFQQLSNFTSVDYGSGRPAGLQEGSLGRLLGVDWYWTQNASAITRGDVANATNVYGGTQTGTTLNVDNGSGTSTGTIYAGASFTINADTTIYTVVEVNGAVGIAASSGAFALTLDQALAASPADNAAITWKTASTGCILYPKMSVCAAIVAPSALEVGSSTFVTDGNVGIRVTMSSSTSTLSDSIVYDAYCGAVMWQRCGAVMQG